MPDDSSDKIWDEYEWERFLQQQELRTEKYMDLLEKYINHPQRDELIAQEMGWTHLLGGDAESWEEEVDAQFEKALAEAQEGEGDDSGFAFEKHPLYQQTIALGAELDELFTSAPARAREHPAAITLQSQVTLAAAKLAAALSDEEIQEIGMSIAYLKRALHATTTSLGATALLHEQEFLSEADADRVRGKLFEIRGGIVCAMGELRAEFRRRNPQ